MRVEILLRRITKNKGLLGFIFCKGYVKISFFLHCSLWLYIIKYISLDVIYIPGAQNFCILIYSLIVTFKRRLRQEIVLLRVFSDRLGNRLHLHFQGCSEWLQNFWKNFLEMVEVWKNIWVNSWGYSFSPWQENFTR